MSDNTTNTTREGVPAPYAVDSEGDAPVLTVPVPPADPRFTTPEEDATIDAAFNEVMQGYLSSNHRKKAEIIERAFQFAREAHRGVRRRSGEPYILHPIAVARIASHEIGLGSTSICAALLHDVVEDTDYTVEDIERNFGTKIARLVDGLTKISGGIFGAKASAQAENFRKLLLTMNDDIRVVLLKMADRLHNMRTLGSMAQAKQYKIAGETLYIYAPLAHRLGLFAIKTELEDLAFKYEHPEAYARIERKLAESEASRTATYSTFAAPIEKALTRMGLTFEAKARLKSVYSIWRKMETKRIPFEEVYDLYAMRIIFECDDPAKEKAMCWAIYSAITDLYRPHPERTRDWITTPKANGYQALHVTLMGADGHWIEVQIRSRRMDEIAEKGFAAHWKYKVGESDEESELSAWLQTIRDILDDPTPNAIDFLDTLKLNLFAQEIVVFTPKGEMVTLPIKSTVLDFAFSLHTQLGVKCIAGKVNHKLVPLSHRLNSGDQVEVLTSNTQRPKLEWMEYLASASARTRLRQALRRERQPLIERGQELYVKFLTDHGVEPTNETLTKVLGSLRIASREELMTQLALGEVSLDDFFERKSEHARQSFLGRLFRRGTDKKRAEETPEPTPVIDRKKTYVLRSTREGDNYRMASCCAPLPGDDVMGYITDDNAVELHALTCPVAQRLKATYGSRIVSTRWESVETVFPAKIMVEGIDRRGVLQELSLLISQEMDIDMRHLEITADNEVFRAELEVLVTDTRVIDKLCRSMLGVEGVQRATRV